MSFYRITSSFLKLEVAIWSLAVVIGMIGEVASADEAAAIAAMQGKTVLACGGRSGVGIVAYETLADGSLVGIGQLEGADFRNAEDRIVVITDSAILIVENGQLTAVEDGTATTMECSDIAVQLVSIMSGISAAAAADGLEQQDKAIAAKVAALDLDIKRRESALQFKEGQLEIREKALIAREEALKAP